jgi:hypothetical protein
MYPQDMLTLPENWLRKVRLWYARGRTWQRVAPKSGVRRPVGEARGSVSRG